MEHVDVRAMTAAPARIVYPGGSNGYAHSYHQQIQDDVHVSLDSWMY